MSAPRASETPSIASANRTVLLPGSPATYANRAFLKGLGLRWDPEGHRWHGTASAENVRALREQLGLEVRCFGSLFQARVTEAASKGPRAPKPVAPTLASHSRVHDGSRTHVEAQLAFADTDSEPEEISVQGRRFSLLEITSGLPDDSREEDGRAEARRLSDLRGPVKRARALVSTTPGLAAVLETDWKRTAGFYGRFGINETQFRFGVRSDADAILP